MDMTIFLTGTLSLQGMSSSHVEAEAEFGSSLEGINMLQSGNAALISATARFASAEAAEAARLTRTGLR